MIETLYPLNESFRLEALKSLNILDTESEKKFDEITALAAFLCDTKSALISLTDSKRQWTKSSYGINICEFPREKSICAHAILDPDNPLIIKDTRNDERFKDNPITKGEYPIIFYAGIPLVNKEGFALGTLCVFNNKPKELSIKQLEALKALANQVVILFELNKKNKDLEKIQNLLEKRNEALKEFAGVISHDLKMPLANIITTSDILKLRLTNHLDKKSLTYFDYIKKSSFSMSDYINDVLDHYESESLINHDPEIFDLNVLLKEIVNLLSIKSDCIIHLPNPSPSLKCNKLALQQIYINLIGNSIKYNDKKEIIIALNFSEDDRFYYFSITDNGMGIPKNRLEFIFDLFTTSDFIDRNGNKGNGIGLSTVKKLIENLGGTIKVLSIEGKQTTFRFSIKK